VPLPAPHAYVPSLTWAIILLAQDTPASRQQARQLLAQLDEYFTSIHDTVIRIRILALQAMLYHAERAESQALATLEKSIALAEPGGFLRLFVDLGPQLKPLLAQLARRGVSPAYLAAIAAAYSEADSQPLTAAPRTSHAMRCVRRLRSDELTNREQDVRCAGQALHRQNRRTLSISGNCSTHVRHIGDSFGAAGGRSSRRPKTRACSPEPAPALILQSQFSTVSSTVSMDVTRFGRMLRLGLCPLSYLEAMRCLKLVRTAELRFVVPSI
jgi:hypothetical protein